MGLQMLSEAHRMLVDDGQLLLTVPSATWGTTLRQHLGIDPMTTRFKLVECEKQVILPSLLYEAERIREMLELCGFKNIEIDGAVVPPGENKLSPDITLVTGILKAEPSALAIIQVIRAQR
jgi:hypothetical protein